MTVSRPVLFGEVLFDRFPDGTAVLGGAPFNVAWHLQAFGLRPLFLSRVGDDPGGRQLLAAMGSWGMDMAGVQIDREHPTGAVEVRLEGGDPSYEILADQAYDHIRAAELAPVPPGALLCHGTLALRAPSSRAALEAVLRAARPRRVVDVNLRAPWWQRDEVLALLREVEIIKLNEHELALLTEAAPDPRERDDGGPARELLERSGAERIVVTRGERGALAFGRQGPPVAGLPRGRASVLDTVGAGDGFTAVVILGECLGWSVPCALERGAEFAEAIVGLRGATTADAAFYKPFLRRWTPA